MKYLEILIWFINVNNIYANQYELDVIERWVLLQSFTILHRAWVLYTLHGFSLLLFILTSLNSVFYLREWFSFIEFHYHRLKIASFGSYRVSLKIVINFYLRRSDLARYKWDYLNTNWITSHIADWLSIWQSRGISDTLSAH